jgi:glycosyltransferase involved in cell wall biosynthesis
MKASFLLTTYNKNDCLPNVLYAMSRQQTSFLVDFCVFDDLSDVDPKSIVREFLPQAKYQRAKKRAGGHHSIPECFKMADEDSDVIITMSSDVVIAEPFGVEKLCQGVGPMKVAMAEVKNIGIPYDLNKNFDEGIVTYLDKWDDYKQFYCCGPERIGFWLFFAALLRKDFITAEFDKLVCDRVNTRRKAGMESGGFTIHCVHEVKSIHQKHSWIAHRCSFAECKYASFCPRKKL